MISSKVMRKRDKKQYIYLKHSRLDEKLGLQKQKYKHFCTSFFRPPKIGLNKSGS